MNWQIQLKSEYITDIQELFNLLDLKTEQIPFTIYPDFPLRITKHYVSKIKKNDPQDPLLLQILPLQQELIEVENFVEDPIKEKEINPLPGLLKRYEGRVLLTLTGFCPINCRFCFRRHFPYDENKALHPEQQQKILHYIAAESSIKEVILSGGEPFMITDDTLNRFCSSIASIKHIKRLRFHTRMPIIFPARFTKKFFAWFADLPLDKTIVVHCNHPNEIDKQVKAITQSLKKICTLLNQSVLLKNINDCPETLIQLNEQLFSAGILPYYLHALDPVKGAHHFEVDKAQGKKLIELMKKNLPGYLIPKFVATIPGEKNKIYL